MTKAENYSITLPIKGLWNKGDIFQIYCQNCTVEQKIFFAAL